MDYKKVYYECLYCRKSFNNNKSHLERHLLRKFPCKNVSGFSIDRQELIVMLNNNSYESYIESLKNKKECEYCKKIFSKKNIRKHESICKLNPDNLKNAQCEEIQLKAHENQQVTNIQNQTNIQNNIQNNNIHIHINGFDKEDLSKIDFEKLTFYEKEDFYKKSFQDKANNHIHNYLSILTDIISEPNNKNFKLLNKKDKKFLIKNNEDDSEITHLDVVKEHFYDVINDSYKDYVSDIKHYQRFLKLIDIEINEYEKGSKEFEATQYYKFIKKLKKYIKDKILWTAEDDKVSNKLSNS